MPVKTIAVLKTYFETGDRPTEAQFADLIDSFIHKTTGSVVTAKSYNEATGDVVISFSNGVEPLVFNIAKSTSEPISFIEGLQDALNNKVDKEAGKGLSSHDFTSELRTKLIELQQVELPTSAEISFINGLQQILDEKANDNEVVKSVTVSGQQYTPDVNGNVDLGEIEGGGSYTLSLDPVVINYKYFNEDVKGVFLEIPDTTDTNFVFTHNLNVGRYFKVQLWRKQHVNGFQNDNPIIDLVEYILAVTASGSVEFQPNSISVNNFNLSDDYLIYVEYTEAAVSVEGINFDAIGAEAIGIG